MASPSTFRAIDIGYRNMKFTIDDGGQSRLIPSLAPRADHHRERARLYRSRDTVEVWVDGDPYEVGPDATLFDDTPILHADYIEMPQYRALLYGALNAMRLSRIDLLVTGLPVHLHETRWRRLKKLVVGVHTIRPGVQVEIRDAVIAIQPLGGLLAYIRERGLRSEADSKTFLFVDPGYYSFDWTVTTGMQEVPGLSGSVECGVAEYLKSIEAELNTALGETHSNLRRIDDGLLRASFRIKGREIDLEPYRAQATAVCRRAVGAMRNQIGAGHQIDEIVLAGGGAAYFLPALREAYPGHQIQTVSDPVFANLRGYHLIGEVFHRRRAA